MTEPSAHRSALLPRLFVIVTVLPALALAWLGWQLIDQDRRLERQRVQDLVESTANGVTAAIERELGTIERSLGATANSERITEGAAAIVARLNREGHATAIAGASLAYQPVVAGATEPSSSVWVDAERLEYQDRDVAAAMLAYRTLGRSSDPEIRAGALVRLARTLKRTGQADEALATYAALADLGARSGVTILGDPADLMARWARVELLATLARMDPLASEAAALDADLRSGRWRLDRTTALTYAQTLARWRTDADTAAFETQLDLSEAVAQLWKDWTETSPAQRFGSGRRSIPVRTGEILVVWRQNGDELLAFATPPGSLLTAWTPLWSASEVAVSLENRDGQPIAGGIPVSSVVTVVKPASDTRLPWTLRVAATSTPTGIAAGSTARRRIIVAVLALLAVVIPATGYLVTKAVRKELALAEQQAGFVAAVSHEFRSPLTSLVHLTSLLRSDFQPTEDRRRRYYDALARETDRLRRFVETLLDVGRIQAGAAGYTLSPVDAGLVVGRVVDEFRSHAACGGHPVSIVTPPHLPCVAADVEALGRALWNLLENAAKYSPDESPIEVHLERANAGIAIRVTDQGAGIPASEQPFIFDQFFRGDAATASAVKGTGVGLAVVRHIVTGHGGEIRLETTPGIGSTFTILLPATPNESVTTSGRIAS